MQTYKHTNTQIYTHARTITFVLSDSVPNTVSLLTIGVFSIKIIIMCYYFF